MGLIQERKRSGRCLGFSTGLWERRTPGPGLVSSGACTAKWLGKTRQTEVSGRMEVLKLGISIQSHLGSLCEAGGFDPYLLILGESSYSTFSFSMYFTYSSGWG